jgi:hypothetical protein
MEAECSYETSVEFCRSTQRYVQEDTTFNSYRCDNLKSDLLRDHTVRLCLHQTVTRMVTPSLRNYWILFLDGPGSIPGNARFFSSQRPA